MLKLAVDEAPLSEKELLYRNVAVATVRARPYYNIISALKLMDLQFDSISPEQAAASSAKVIITTQDEACIINNKKGAVMLDTELDKYPTIVKARILRSIVGGAYSDDQLTIGIDPGSRIGISVIYLHREIASGVESSPEGAVEQVSAMLGGIDSRKKIVRIGDGNISMARQMAGVLKMRFGDAVRVEIVDEHGTSQNPDANKRGARDRSSARTIAFRTGKSYTLK